MIIKKPFITVALFIGVVLLAIFSVNLLSPAFKINRLAIAIAESLAAVACLMAALFGILYFAVRERNKPAGTQSGIVTKRSATDSKTVIRAMPITG